MDTLTLTLRIIGVAQLVIVACLALRDLRLSLLGALVALFCFGVGAYLLCPVIATQWDIGPLEIPLYFGCFGMPVFFWLLSQAIFADGLQLRPMHGAVLGLLEALGFWHLAEKTYGPLLWDFDTTAATLVVHQFLSLGIIIWSLVAAYRGRRIDLVEPRQRFREIFVASVGSYMILIVAFEILLNGRLVTGEIELINVAAILMLILAASFSMLQFSDKVLAVASQGRKTPDPAAAIDQALLTSLHDFMDGGGFRHAGLTIGDLAERLNAREHSLRRVINGGLGFRNFNAFLNSYRIGEARELLAQSKQTRLPILNIAMDLGYGSVGPFNRAFKEATGQTPSEYRASSGKAAV